jgi:YD repeat-containing protein
MIERIYVVLSTSRKATALHTVSDRFRVRARDVDVLAGSANPRMPHMFDLTGRSAEPDRSRTSDTLVSGPQHRMLCWFRIAVTGLTVLFCANGIAQNAGAPGINSPTYSLTDQNGVNLTSFRPSAQINDVSIGAKERPLSHWMMTDDGDTSIPTIRFADSYWGKVQTAYAYDESPTCAGTNFLDASLGVSADRMCGVTGGTFSALRGTGSSMVTNADGTLTYTQADGTTRFYGIKQSSISWLLTRITAPDGLVTTLRYKSATVSGTTIYRLQSVTRNDGLQLKYTYGSNAAPTTSADSPWRQIASVSAINNAVDYCDPQADTCTFTQAWPVTTYTRVTSGSLKYFTVLDAAGRATRFTTGIPTLSGGVYGPSGPLNYTTHQLLAIRAPTSSSTDTVTFTYCAVSGEYNCMHEGIKKLNVNGYDWLYSATSGSGGVSLFIQTKASRPVGGDQITQQQRGNYSAGPLISYSDGIGHRTFYFGTSLANRVSHVTQGDGDDLSYLYDGRGNITQETHTPSSGSSLTATVRTADFDSSCTNPVKCNKPNWIRDARGYQTDYTYDATHGGLLQVTSPADASGVRPQVRYTYTQRYAWYKNSSGTITQAASPIWVLSTEQYCRKSAAQSGGCSIAGDEVTVAYDYGPSNAANNLFLRGKSVTADGVTHRSCYGYDIYGNRVSETSPNAGLSTCP